MTKVWVAKVYEYITRHDSLAGKTFMKTGGKYSFGSHTITVGKAVKVPANFEPPSKWAASKQYRLHRHHPDDYGS